MGRKAAKELIHIKGWLDRVDEILERGKDAYLACDLLQEAGDSLMMKLGEGANRLSRLGVLAPDGVEWALAVANRNFIIHQYDEINRELTWLTLSRDLPAFPLRDRRCGLGWGRDAMSVIVPWDRAYRRARRRRSLVAGRGGGRGRRAATTESTAMPVAIGTSTPCGQ
jgi:uncharacterized protein with HEPN domain